MQTTGNEGDNFEAWLRTEFDGTIETFSNQVGISKPTIYKLFKKDVIEDKYRVPLAKYLLSIGTNLGSVLSYKSSFSNPNLQVNESGDNIQTQGKGNTVTKNAGASTERIEFLEKENATLKAQNMKLLEIIANLTSK